MYSSTIAAVILNILVTVLPWLGINIGSDQLTTTVQTLVAIGTGIWIWYQRTKLVSAKTVGVASDVNAAGFKK